MDIEVRKAGEDGRLSVTLGYQLDGEAVMQSMTIEASAKQAKVVRSDNGGVALSLTLAPKTVSVEEPPESSRPRFEVEDTDDPLAGV